MIHASFLVIASVLLTTGNAVPDPPGGRDLAPVSLSLEDGGALAGVSATEVSEDLGPATFTFGSAAHRPASLPILYASGVALQAYDAYSTFAVLKRGGVEANPLMKGATHPAVFLAIKGATSALTIAVAERMWRKQGRRKAAVTLLVVTNGVLAIVAAHNASVLRQLR